MDEMARRHAKSSDSALVVAEERWAAEAVKTKQRMERQHSATITAVTADLKLQHERTLAALEARLSVEQGELRARLGKERRTEKSAAEAKVVALEGELAEVRRAKLLETNKVGARRYMKSKLFKSSP